MIKYSLHLVFVVCRSILISALVWQTTFSMESDIYERGQAARKMGNWENALKIWSTALDSVANDAATDPRVGIGFIELATEKEAAQYYEQASIEYLRSLTRADPKQHHASLREEILRLAPVLDVDTATLWHERLERGDRALGGEFKAFWMTRDPIPTTIVNERLIEHWERIAIARKQFNAAKTTVYGTDDRGLVFVKYGAPDARYAGKLGLDQLEIMRWLDDFLVRQEVLRFNSKPEYEIWHYFSLQEDETTLFLFGKKRGFGKYGLRYGIEEFIPGNAFRRSSARAAAGVLPGGMLQLMYYSELRGIDSHYQDRFKAVETQWLNSRGSGRLGPDREVVLGTLGYYKSVDQGVLNFKYLPLDRTSVFDAFEPLYLNYKTFRYLSPENRPRLSIMVVSGNATREAGFAVPFFTPSKRTKFKHRHILIQYGQEWERNEIALMYPDLHNHNTSVFDSLQNADKHLYSLTAERVILDVRKSELSRADLPDTAKVVGVQSVFLGDLQSLDSDSSRFQVSDLIVGKDTPEDVSNEFTYPFPVIPSDPVKSDSVKVYFQIYHLALTDNESAVRLECEMKALKRSGKLDKKTERLKKTFDPVLSAATTDQVIALNISNLKTGRYELSMKIRSKTAKREIIRKSVFRIAR